MRQVLWSRLLVLTLAIAIGIAATFGGVGAGGLSGLEARGQRRVGVVGASGVVPGVVYTANQISASGRLTTAAYTALTCPKAWMGAGEGKRLRSIEVGAASTGAAASTWDTKVYLAKSGYPIGGNYVQDWDLAYVGTLTCTVGSAFGVSDTGAVLTTERIVSGMAWTAGTAATTPPGISLYLQSAFASSPITVYSPGGATPARIMFPDCGNGEYFVFDPGSTGGSSVCFYVDTGT